MSVLTQRLRCYFASTFRPSSAVPSGLRTRQQKAQPPELSMTFNISSFQRLPAWRHSASAGWRFGRPPSPHRASLRWCALPAAPRTWALASLRAARMASSAFGVAGLCLIAAGASALHPPAHRLVTVPGCPEQLIHSLSGSALYQGPDDLAPHLCMAHSDRPQQRRVHVVAGEARQTGAGHFLFVIAACSPDRKAGRVILLPPGVLISTLKSTTSGANGLS